MQLVEFGGSDRGSDGFRSSLDIFRGVEVATAQDESRDLFELIGVQPSAVFVAAIDDDSRLLAIVVTLHIGFANGAPPVLNALRGGVGAGSPRLDSARFESKFIFGFLLGLDGAVNQ